MCHSLAQSMAEVFMERGIAQGIEQGKAEGIERGIEQSETRAKQTALLKLLQFRFEPIPQALTNQIASIRSLAWLGALFEQVLAAQTLDDIDWQNHDD